MIKITLIIIAIFVCYNFINAQNDTMYIMKSGQVVGKYNVNNQVDSIIFYQPKQGNSFIDNRDGNVYKTIAIGNQVWMAENLKYLPSVTDPWSDSYKDPYYYVYSYLSNVVNEAKATVSYKTYGVLYNWPAAMNGALSSTSNPSGVQGVCPAGWHLPSDSEWLQLENYLADNGYNYDGTTGGGRQKIAKALADSSKWFNSANSGAVGSLTYPPIRNKSGFTAIPGGYRDPTGSFYNQGEACTWWSTTEYNTNKVWDRTLFYSMVNVSRNTRDKNVGYSVRCVKD